VCPKIKNRLTIKDYLYYLLFTVVSLRARRVSLYMIHVGKQRNETESHTTFKVLSDSIWT
jgi:hypothetical protein